MIKSRYSQLQSDWPLISILIVNFNGADVLENCLGSLESVTYPRLEIIVVDNGSSDDSIQVISRFQNIRLIRSDCNRGFTGGNNLGLPACKGEFVLLLNSDTIVTPDFLQPLASYLKKNKHVGIVQGKMLLSRHGNVLDVCGSFLTRFGFLYHYGYWKPDSGFYNHSYPVFTVKGACMMFRRDLISKVGGYLFNEDFFCYYEETDFCHRAWLAGFEVHFVHESVIQHLQGATSERTQKTGWMLEHYLGNQSFSLFSNLSVGSLARIAPFYCILFLISMIASVLMFRLTVFTAHKNALIQTLLNFRKIRLQRERVRKKIRTVPDRFFFDKIAYNPRLDYFVKTFRGMLNKYRDAPIRDWGKLKTSVK